MSGSVVVNGSGVNIEGSSALESVESALLTSLPQGGDPAHASSKHDQT